MTATPKETKYISNIDYFGEAIYTYSLREGIEDGFLAPFKVINVTTDIGEGWRPCKGQTDIYGNDTVGKRKLTYFISPSKEGPVIATTSKLLSTGADCKMTKLIVLDQMIGSMTEFK